MFHVNWYGCVVLQDCPAHGVGALDWRRAQNLPDGDDNIPPIAVDLTDEALWRAVSAAAPHGYRLADCDWSASADTGKPGHSGQNARLSNASCLDSVRPTVTAEIARGILAGDHAAITTLAGIYEAAWQSQREANIQDALARPMHYWTRHEGWMDMDTPVRPDTYYAGMDNTDDPRIIDLRNRVLLYIEQENAELAQRLAEKKAKREAAHAKYIAEQEAEKAARELLKGEFARATEEHAETKRELAQSEADANLLAKVIAALPPDALTGVVNDLAAQKTAAEAAELRARIERAAGILHADDYDDESAE